RVVGPERHFRSVGRVGEEQSPAQILAGELDEDVRVIKDRRLDEAVTGVGEQRAERGEGIGHRRWRGETPTSSGCLRAYLHTPPSRARLRFTAATSSDSGTSNWPGRSSR